MGKNIIELEWKRKKKLWNEVKELNEVEVKRGGEKRDLHIKQWRNKKEKKNGCSVRMYERLAGGKGKAAFMFKRRQKKTWSSKKQRDERKLKTARWESLIKDETKRNSWERTDVLKQKKTVYINITELGLNRFCKSITCT